jgi:N,N'-diacetyllegionaminate synthase
MQMKIIAESAYNHMGKLDEVLALLQAAKESGAHYFTVQIMDPVAFSDVNYSKHQLYIDHNISFEDWAKVIKKGDETGLPVIPCPLDEKSLDFVFSLGIDLIKVHATDLTNPLFLKKIKERSQTRVILETQAATNFEIRYALSIIRDQVEALLTGYSNYPTELEDLNLDSLDFLKKEYGLPFGLADHSPTVTDIPLMALAKGCAYLEKHITLTRNNRNFDWQVSIYPEEFRILVEKVKLFRKALGNGVKHPVKNELPHRDVLYKKVLPDGSIKRADEAPSFVAHTIKGFSKDRVAIGIIARLKSQRLPKKVLADLGEEKLIEALYHNISQARRPTDIRLATSTLPADDELAEHCAELNIPVFRGHPDSVIDRLLDLAWESRSGIVLRVTGDNPFTSPELTDAIIELVRNEKVDYARVNNVPFGMSAEAFSVEYLWDLYLRMENPMVSEYLTWFVLLDEKCRKGCIDLELEGKELSLKNLSVDYPQDLEGCQKVLECAGKSKVSEVSLEEALRCSYELLTDKEDAYMKLPGGTTMLISEYIERWKNADYVVRKKYGIRN